MRERVDSDTRKTRFRRLWKAGKGSLPITLEPGLTPKNLESLVLAHRKERYARALYQLLALHPAANGRIFRLLLAESGESPDIESSIILSGKASKAMLRAFRKSTSPSVRDHAELVLLGASLDSGGRETFKRLLEKHWGKDAGISLAVRELIAQHPKAPRNILRRLSRDDADFIAAVAKKRLVAP